MKRISVLACAALTASALAILPAFACQDGKGCASEGNCAKPRCAQCQKAETEPGENLCDEIPEQIELSASCDKNGITESRSITIPKYEEYIISEIETDAASFIIKSESGEAYDSALIKKADEFKLMSGTYTVVPSLKKGQKKASVRITLDRWHGARG